MEELEDTLVEEETAVDPAMQEEIDRIKRGMTTLYGDAFPLAKDVEPEDKDWKSWVEELWSRHSAGIQSRLHLIERNRLFRRGIQWVSAISMGPWREPPKPRDSARPVRNMIQPALAQRMQVVADQRPGFKTRPQSLDPMRVKRAEAQQILLDYQYDQQQMPDIIRELAYWAGTDGVAFGELYWDVDRGPWDDSASQPMGEPCVKVRRMEHVRVSANATATQKPWYWIVREVIPLAQAVAEYGPGVTDNITEADLNYDSMVHTTPSVRMGYQLPSGEELHRDQKLVDRYTVYCEKSEFLPEGLTLIVVGGIVMFQGPLLIGRVPIFRFTDGSEDPGFYVTPVMDAWIDSQMRINAVLAKWVENLRYNAGPKLMAKQHAIVGETLHGGTMSVIDVKGMGDIQSLVRPVEGFSLAPDAKELLDREIKTFEDLSGYNDVSRGQFAPDQSGRAILAIREQLERVFAPAVNAAARAMTDWAKITLAMCAWGYDQSRTVAMMGEGRPDLSRTIEQEDLNGVVDVWIDPETLMPMPRALRMFLLDSMFEKGLVSPQEYRQRQQFAWTRNMQYADEEHEARGRRVCEAIRMTANPMALPILWMDDEAIHQDILQRELLLPDDIPMQIRSAAFERWMMLAQQAAMKAQGMLPPTAMTPPMGGGGGGKPGSSPNDMQLPAAQQPFQSTSPGTSAANAAAMSGPDENRAARAFDQQPH